jgi:hypothetical protein
VKRASSGRRSRRMWIESKNERMGHGHVILVRNP